nr:putative lipase ROG1 isoform X1 [Tanacetum cinerariifolium]
MSDNTKKAQCVHCLHFFSKDSNSALKNHISHPHCEALKRAAKPGQSSMSRNESIFVYNLDVLREQFAGLVIQRGLPFNHFDDEQTTRVFQNHLQPKYNHDEMRRLEATGTYTYDEINRLARRGKQRGHIPSVSRVLPARVTAGPIESVGANGNGGSGVCGDDDESADNQEDEDEDGDGDSYDMSPEEMCHGGTNYLTENYVGPTVSLGNVSLVSVPQRQVAREAGGVNVFSCAESDVSTADHLLVMVNGILGSSADWKFAAEQFVKAIPDKVFVHRSERNAATQTLDGVDVMGERLSQEVLEVIKQKPNLRKISFVAHSVGGLVARYAIGRLYRPPKENLEGLSVEDSEESRPMIGDDDDGKPPLLQRMLQDFDDCYFMSALRSFHRLVAYSNAGCDHIVGWRTSSIRRNVELPKWEDSINEKYPHIVYEERCKAYDGKQNLTDGDTINDVEEELVTGLSRVSWEKVDVSFHNSKLRFAAHSVIQVKDDYLHTDGADVIQHMIDHFCV